MSWQCIVLGWGVPLVFWLAAKAYAGRRMSTTVSRDTPAPQPNPQVPVRTRRMLAQGLSPEGWPKPERVLPESEHHNNKEARRQ